MVAWALGVAGERENAGWWIQFLSIKFFLKYVVDIFCEKVFYTFSGPQVDLQYLSFNFCIKLGLRWGNLYIEQKEGSREHGVRMG